MNSILSFGTTLQLLNFSPPCLIVTLPAFL